MFGFGILSGLTFLPLVGAALILLVPGESETAKNNIRWIALWTTLVTFAVSLVIWAKFDPAQSGFQMIEQQAWVGNGISYKLGVDGISMLFVILTTFLMPLCILASWESIDERVKEYICLLYTSPSPRD